MRILDWINKVVPSYKRGAWADLASLEDEYVIKECKYCCHVKKREIFPDIFEPFCESKDADRYGEPARDGCINFEEGE